MCVHSHALVRFHVRMRVCVHHKRVCLYAFTVTCVGKLASSCIPTTVYEDDSKSLS